MASLFNAKLKNNFTLFSKDKIKRPNSKKEKIHKFLKNKKNISKDVLKYENSQGLSTQLYTILNSEYKTEYDTAQTRPSLDFMETTRDKTLITNYKPTKLTLRNNTNLGKKTMTNHFLTQKQKSQKAILKVRTEKNYRVPKEFMEAMKLDIRSNIIKANKYIKNERKKIINENPNLKYYFLYKNKKLKEKNEELRRFYEYKMTKMNLNKKNKNINNYNLNAYYTKLLIKENEQHFNINRPMIDRNKFSKKFIMFQEDTEIKKQFPNKNIRLIFSKLLYDKVFMNNEKKIIQTPKNVLHKKLISAIKKSAIEFKNIKISFNEYVEYYYQSKSIAYQLFNNEYSYLINLIRSEKKEEEEKNSEKDKNVCEFLDKNKFPIYVIDFFGKSALILVTRKRLYKSLAKIIQYGGNINIQDFKGRTALHFAVMNNDLIAVIILLYFLADPDIKDKSGNIPLDYINKNNDNYIIKEILMRCNLIKKLNKYRSWKEYDICIRRGLQFYLYNILSKDKYESIFYLIENPVLYYK